MAMEVVHLVESQIAVVDNGGVDCLAVVFPDEGSLDRVFPPAGWRFNQGELCWRDNGEITVGLSHLGAPGYEALIEPPRTEEERAAETAAAGLPEPRGEGCSDVLCDWTPLSGCRPCQEPGEYPCGRACCDG